MRASFARETHVDGGQTVYAWEWDYDAAGNREYQVFNGEATYYAYNAANELLTETTDGQTTYYSYDGCGNTTAKQEAAGTTYYQWDHENLMTRIDLADGGHNYFAYDADSKRVSKRDSEGFTEFIYQGPDMLRLLLERDEAGDTQVHYTMGAGLEAMRRADGGDIASGDSSFYHFDWLGSTFELTDDEQTVTDTYLYNAWGEVLARTGTTENPHQWVGRERYLAIHDTPLALLGVRHCVLGAGRFISRDPAGARTNWFRYVANRPSVDVDPVGRWGGAEHAELVEEAGSNLVVVISATPKVEFVARLGPLVSTIAAASAQVDTDYSTVFGPKNWPMHFNWPIGSQSRQKWFEQNWRHVQELGLNAIGLSALCYRLAASAGAGLHALQDAHSHMDLTPWEHMDSANYPQVDKPEFDSGGPGTAREFSPTSMYGGVAGQVIWRRLKGWVGEAALAKTRPFNWVRVFDEGGRIVRGNRWRGALDETRGVLEDFLRTTCCGVRERREV